MKHLNRNGFTLIELIMVIVILGIITAFSIPMVRNIQKKNDISKFKVFEDSLINGAKLYVDAYGDDEFDGTGTCIDIKYGEMKDKMLVKDFPEKSINCNNDDTFVRVIREDTDKYKYEVEIVCKVQNKIVFEENNISDDEKIC